MNGNEENYTTAYHLIDALEFVDDVDATQDAEHGNGEIGEYVEKLHRMQPLLRHLCVIPTKMPHGSEKTVNIEEKVYEICDNATDDVTHHRLLL